MHDHTYVKCMIIRTMPRIAIPSYLATCGKLNT